MIFWFWLLVGQKTHLWLGVLVLAFNPALRKQRQADLCAFTASLIYKADAGTITQRNPASEKPQTKEKRKARKYPREGG